MKVYRNRSRRGVALELAITTMLTLFALAMILTTLSLYIIQEASEQTEGVNHTIAADAIGEDFVYAVRKETDFNPESYAYAYPNYVITFNISPDSAYLRVANKQTVTTPAVYDDDGNLIRGETTRLTEVHLLTVELAVEHPFEDALPTVTILRWLYSE